MPGLLQGFYCYISIELSQNRFPDGQNNKLYNQYPTLICPSSSLFCESLQELARSPIALGRRPRELAPRLANLSQLNRTSYAKPRVGREPGQPATTTMHWIYEKCLSALLRSMICCRSAYFEKITSGNITLLTRKPSML